MQKSEAAAYLAGAKQVEGAEASAPTNLHVISGEVIEKSEEGKVKVDLGGLVFSEDDEQAIEIDTLGGLEVGDTATILLAGQEGRGLAPLGIGGVGTVDRVVKKIEGFETDYVKTEVLEANYAHIANGVIDNAKIDHANVNNLEANYAHIKNGVIDNAKLNGTDIVDGTITGSKIKASSITGSNIDGSSFTNGQISGSAIDSSTLTNIPYAEIDALKAKNITADAIEAAKAYVEALTARSITAQDISADHATIASLDSNYAHITNGVIDNATIGYADVNNLSAHYAEIQNGHINSALIDTAAIVDEQVFTVTGNKATLASIDASKINVTNLNADNITVNKINGQPVTGKSISDALSQHETDISTKVDTTTFNNTVDGLNDRIDGAIETFTGTVVPTLNNTPASSWNTTKLRDEHVGDVYYVVNASSQQNGYCYRFTKSGSEYSWQLIKDSDVTAALSRLQTAEGKITTFDSDISTLKTDTGELKTKTQSLETSLGDKVDVTTFNDLSSDVEENSATITTLSNTVSQKADSATVTTLSNTVNQVKQTADTNKTSITNLTQTVNQKADSSTVTTLTQRTSTIEQNLSGITTRVGKTESTLETVSNPNLTPWFSVSVNDTSYWQSLHCRNTSVTNTEGLHGIWDGEDGWAHITLDARTSAGNDGSKSCYMNMHVAHPKIADKVTSGEKYTWLIEVKNLTWIAGASGNALGVWPSVNNATLDVFNACHKSFTEDGVQWGVVTAKADFSSLTMDTRGYCYVPTGCYADFDLRISLYEGEYSGPYKPYVDQTLSNRVKSAETSIEQNAEAITLRATKNVVSQTVRNLLSGTAIPDIKNESYSTHVDEIAGGTAIYKWTDGMTLSKVSGAIRLDFTGTNQGIVVPLVAEDCITAGETVTISYTYRTNIPNTSFNNWFLHTPSPNANNGHAIKLDGDEEWHDASVSWNVTLKTGTVYAMLLFYGNTANGHWLEIKDGTLFLERGDTRYASQAELKVANDSISSKVSTTDYNGNKIASLINQSAESVKIQANHVEIDGTTVFTSGTTLSDYVSGTANTAASTAVGNLQIGGRNLLWKTGSLPASWVPNACVVTDAQDDPFGGKNAVLVTPSSSAHYFVYRWPAFGMAKHPANGRGGGNFTFSVWLKAADGSANVGISVRNANSGKRMETVEVPDTWTLYEVTCTVLDTITNNDVVWVGQAGTAAYYVSYPKFEQGTKATDWSPAPEDQTAYVDESVDSIQIGSRNLLRDSAFQSSLGKYWVADGVTASISNGTLIVEGTGGSGNRRVYQGLEWFKHMPDTTYTFSCDVVSSVACQIAFGRKYAGCNEYHVAFDVTTSVKRVSGVYTATNNAAFCIGQPTNNATVTISNIKLEKGNKATDWTPAPEDVSADAVKRTQRIYYRKSVTGAPAAPSSWVVSYGDGSNAWTQKHISISNADKYIYTCEQYEMADGTLGHTSILLDDTITVIDGGKILTGTVEANALKAKSLTLGNFTDAAANSIDNSKVQVGGRNILRRTGAGFSDFEVNTTSFATHHLYSTGTSDTAYDGKKLSDFGLVAGDEITLSFDWSTSANGSNAMRYGTFHTEFYGVKADGTNGYTAMFGTRVTMSASNASGHYSQTMTLTALTANTLRMVMRIDNSCLVMSVSNVKLEKGNKATDWTPAPEDVDSSILSTRQDFSDQIDPINESIGDLTTDINDHERRLKSTEDLLDQVKSMVDNLENTTSWFSFNSDTGLIIGDNPSDGSSFFYTQQKGSFMSFNQMSASGSTELMKLSGTNGVEAQKVAAEEVVTSLISSDWAIRLEGDMFSIDYIGS